MSSPMQIISQISGEDDRDTAALRALADNAKIFLQSFAWCPPIRQMYLAFGMADVLGLFLAKFDVKIQGTDDRLWIVVGDVPHAYFIVEAKDSPRTALERYCSLMEQWVFEVLSFGDFQDVYPVAAERTSANADQLRRRIDFIRSELNLLASDKAIE